MGLRVVFELIQACVPLSIDVDARRCRSMAPRCRLS
jgi:hypothetical protein